MRFRQQSRSHGSLPSVSEQSQYSQEKANICDTPNKCKQKVVSNMLSCCNICIDDLHLDDHPYKWGFYEYLDNPPWSPMGSFPLPQPPASGDDPTTETEANRAAIAQVDTPCPEGELDDFKKPCCRPCQESPTSRHKVVCFQDDPKHACAHAFCRLAQTITTNTTRLQASTTVFPPSKSSQIVVQVVYHVAVGAHITCVLIWRRDPTFRFVFRVYTLLRRMFYYICANNADATGCHEYGIGFIHLCVLCFLSRLTRAMHEQKLWYALCKNYDGDLNPQSQDAP